LFTKRLFFTGFIGFILLLFVAKLLFYLTFIAYIKIVIQLFTGYWLLK